MEQGEGASSKGKGLGNHEGQAVDEHPRWSGLGGGAAAVEEKPSAEADNDDAFQKSENE